MIIHQSRYIIFPRKRNVVFATEKCLACIAIQTNNVSCFCLVSY